MRKQMREKSVQRECAIFTGDQMDVAGRDDELVVCSDGEIAHIPRADELRGVVDDAHI